MTEAAASWRHFTSVYAAPRPGEWSVTQSCKSGRDWRMLFLFFFCHWKNLLPGTLKSNSYTCVAAELL